MTKVISKSLCWAVWAALALPLAGCDQLGIETPAKSLERQEAEAKAIGSACRHAMRAIEDCYVLNPKAEKSAIFNGWREMDEYMRENKLEGVAPTVPRPPLLGAKPKKKSEDADESETVEDEHADAPKAEGGGKGGGASAPGKEASGPAKAAS